MLNKRKNLVYVIMVFIAFGLTVLTAIVTVSFASEEKPKMIESKVVSTKAAVSNEGDWGQTRPDH